MSAKRTGTTVVQNEWRRVRRMIQAAIAGESAQMLALQQVAQGSDGTLKEFARVLVGEREFPDFENLKPEDAEGAAPSAEDWLWFAETCCYMAAEESAPEMAPDEWSRRARLGQWHILSLQGNFPLGWDFPLAWAYVWSKEEPYVIEGFIRGLAPSWSLASTPRRWSVAAGLVTAFRYGLLTPPIDWLPFALAYGRWVYGMPEVPALHPEASLGNLLEAMGVNPPTDLSLAELQALACVDASGRYSQELGTRRIPLAAPEVQCRASWVNGYLERVAIQLSVGELGTDVARFRKSKNPVKRYVIWVNHRWDGLEYDPHDPFGEGRSIFWTAVGRPQEDVRPPTYAQCLAHKRKPKK